MHATGPGLEVLPSGRTRAVETSPGEVFVLPGATLTDLTGGAVTALDHQVRNLRLSDRQSIMYFVNPELDHPVHAWVGDAPQRAVDLRDAVRNRPSAYGLPAVPEL
jgi:isopenicillin N synthase-like dioxygenase